MVRIGSAEDDLGGRRGTEEASEGDVTGVVEVLATEEHHLSGQERVANCVDLGI